MIEGGTQPDLKVLLVTPSFSGSPTGNQARMNDILAYARREGGRVDYEIVPLVQKTPPTKTDNQNVHFQGGSRLDRVTFTLRQSIRKRSEVDVVHVAGFPPMVGIAATSLAIGKPLVVGPNIAGRVPPRALIDQQTWRVIQSEKPWLTRRWRLYGETLERAKFRILQSQAYPSTSFLSFSHFMSSILHDRGVNPESVTVLPSGVCREIFHSPKTDRHNPSNPLELLFVGAPTRRKGMPTLVDAVDRLVKSGVDVTVTVAGAATPPAYLGEQSVLDKHFRFVGYVPREELPLYYHEADAFVIPSYFELESTVMIEALSCGTPCVTTDGPSFREVGKSDTCVYFRKGSPSALAEAIRTLRSKYSKYSRAAHTNASDYDISATYRELVRVYEDLVAKQSK